MKNSQSIRAFLDAPDTVGFIVRSSDEIDHLLAEHPNIIATQTLAGRYIVCYTSADLYPSVLRQLGTDYLSSIAIVLGLLGRPCPEKSEILSIQQQSYLNLRGGGVLMGFVDTGIDYTQQVFRYEDGTSKIQYLYDQSVSGDPPQGFYIGTEYTNEQINQALRSENPYEIVPSRDTVGHGTFLASVAAGRKAGGFIGAAPDAELIVVKLKKARPYDLQAFSVPSEQGNAFSSISVMVGVEYILQKARELNRPVVICLGVGSNWGSHDGFSIFEEYLSEVSNLAGVCLCVAAGNESQAKHHVKGTITATKETQNIDIMVSEPANLLLSIWNSMADKLSVSILSPAGESIARTPPKAGDIRKIDLMLTRSQVSMACYFPLEGSGGQLTTVRILGASPGIWTITMHGDIIIDGTFHGWLPLTGFVSPDVELFAANPYYTVTIPSTALGVISCGAYDSANDSLYLNTSWGPTRIERMVPDLVAPGADISGFYPTGRGTMSGTSVAAAITAGACALMLQWGVVQGNDTLLGTYQIRAYLIRGCDRTQRMPYPNPQWGYGALNLLQSFHLMREM